MSKTIKLCKRGHARIPTNLRGRTCRLCAAITGKIYKAERKDYYRHLYREWAKKNVDYRKFANIRREYNLSREEYFALMRRQDEKCGICRETKPLVVDHDHKTGSVRGLLCYKCNSWVLPIVEHSKSLVNAAENYLLQRPQPHFNSASRSMITEGVSVHGLK